MVEKQLDRTKTHLGRSPQGVFGVHYYLLAGYARSRRCSQLAASRPSLSSQRNAARSLAAR